MPYKSVLYKKWPRSPSCPLKRLAKTPYKSVLYRKWPRNPSCPLKLLAKTPYKSDSKT